jgi:hypothetical protein
LIVALIAVVLAIVGWFRPSTGPGSFTDQQRAAAAAAICKMSASVESAVGINTHRRNVDGGPAGALAVASNARLALYGGGAYLQNQLTNQPATPDDLADAVSSMGQTLQQLGIGYLADAHDTDLQPLRDDLNSQIQQINDLCQ